MTTLQIEQIEQIEQEKTPEEELASFCSDASLWTTLKDAWDLDEPAPEGLTTIEILAVIAQRLGRIANALEAKTAHPVLVLPRHAIPTEAPRSSE